MGIFQNLFKTQSLEKEVGLTGLTEELFCVYLTNILAQQKKSILLVTASLFEANQYKNMLDSYTDESYLFPMDDFLTSEAIAVSPELLVTRLETIHAILDDEHPKIVITNLMGYLRYLPSISTYQNSVISFSLGTDIAPSQVVERLYEIGYSKESIVTKTGEFAVRGFVIDVFPLGNEHPVRFEFFGDTIDSIRLFDEETQSSIEKLDRILIQPYSDTLFDQPVPEDKKMQKYLPDYSKSISNISDYLSNSITVFKDYEQICASYEGILNEVLEYRTEKDIYYQGQYMYDFYHISSDYVIYYMTLNNLISKKGIPIITYHSKEILSFQENLESLESFLKEQLYLNKTVVICLRDYQIKSLEKYLHVPYVHSTEMTIELHRLNLVEKVIGHGFLYEDYIFLSAYEIFKEHTNKKKYKTNFKYASKIKDINKLAIGDYIVHNIHGIGIYHGIKTLKHGEFLKDYVEILYAGKDKLYIPVEKIDLISKYTGKEGLVPKVHRLGGTEWKKTKMRVREKVHDVAETLLKIYAERELKKGFMYSKDSDLQLQFERAFDFQETRDQLLAVEQIKEEMESSHPMDRLLCGDVGYGKTEVAFRAIFKAVMDSKQVLYLCPTTILSNQHYKNAQIRFQNFPVRLALLNRFTSVKETKEVLKGLKDGTIDVVFGTHRLLSDDIQPKDLGLLVIDEEQRFGVMHKEKIKKYKANIDVLTLTATPIPRTLQMSMVGLRSLSLIETPPVDRYPVQTYVIEENDQIIKDAIYKEVSRGGQVFLLYNRVESIEREVQKIQSLVPQVRLVYAHGQMNKVELEKRMMDFVDHVYDVLVCTTIIETGIDIPNVNTLIIVDADRFGLSQLYQIRGRVGRSNRIAYAYLMYKKGRVLTETAMKRLNVIKEFTELGSGFSIATRDLSIRGAGDILGSEQAGFIDVVGIDLYLKMLNDEVARLKGETVVDDDMQDEKPLLDVSTHISNEYVEDTDLKIEIHKKINEIDSAEMFYHVKTELEDRFGQLNDTLLIYMKEEWFEKLARRYEIEKVNQMRNFIELTFSTSITQNIDGEKLFTEAFRITPMFRFMMKSGHLKIILDLIKLEGHYLDYLLPLLQNLPLKEDKKYNV